MRGTHWQLRALARLTIIIHISAYLLLSAERYNESVREQKNLRTIVDVYLDFRSLTMRACIITCAARVRTLCLCIIMYCIIRRRRCRRPSRFPLDASAYVHLAVPGRARPPRRARAAVIVKSGRQ